MGGGSVSSQTLHQQRLQSVREIPVNNSVGQFPVIEQTMGVIMAAEEGAVIAGAVEECACGDVGVAGRVGNGSTYVLYGDPPANPLPTHATSANSCLRYSRGPCN